MAVVLQDDALSHLDTRVVAPLIPVSADRQVDRATPQVEIDGLPYAVAIHLMTTISKRNLGALVARLDAHERALKNALDFVFFGV
jgi:hypothetical protein